MGILDTIKKAFDMLPAIAGSLGQLAITVTILATVIGVFIYQTTTGGNINIDGNATQGSYKLISDQSSNFSGIITTVWSSATSVAGFIVLGVIALIAVGILGKKFLGGGGAKI